MFNSYLAPKSRIAFARIALVGMTFLTFFWLATAESSAALIHHWRFDEPDGTAPPQIQNSVSSNHGTFNVNMNDTNRSTDRPVPTNVGRSLMFDGVNETVTLTSQIALGDTSNYSLAFWYRGTETGEVDDNGRTLIGRNSGDTHANFIVRGGKAEFMHYNSAYIHNIASVTSINNDMWHHIAYVNHSNETGDLYIDGILEVSAASSSISNDSFPFRIDGFMLGSINRFADGKLDDVRIYNHALTSAEVAALVATVPEPSTLALVGLGVIRLAIHHRRRRAAA